MVYLAHHYNHEVVTPFTGDSLFLVDQSIPTQKRIDAEVKRVKEMTHASKLRSSLRGPTVKKKGVMEKKVAEGRSGFESSSRSTSISSLAFRRYSEEVSPPEQKREVLWGAGRA